MYVCVPIITVSVVCLVCSIQFCSCCCECCESADSVLVSQSLSAVAVVVNLCLPLTAMWLDQCQVVTLVAESMSLPVTVVVVN